MSEPTPSDVSERSDLKGPPSAGEGAVVAPVTSEAQSVKVSRAGRNLPAAVGVGVALGVAIVVTLFVLPKWTFVVLATASVCVGVWELCRAMRAGGFEVPVVPSVVGAVSMLASAYVGGGSALLICFALTVIAVLVWRVADGVAGAARDVMGGAVVAAYPSLLAAFSSLLLAPGDGAWRLFTYIALTVASDVGGYAVGVLVGRHPMAPTISPKKSWEGFAGSIVWCMAVGVACVVLALHGPWWVGLVVGLAAAIGATTGDLVESTIKRDLGIKDMSNILPGHGGLMDRLDSLVMTAPIVWAVLAALVPPTG